MDKAVRNDDSPKFFGNTHVVKSNDDFESKSKENLIQFEQIGQNSKTGMSQDDT